MKPALTRANGSLSLTKDHETLPRTGFGECMAQCGEIFQGQIKDSDQRLRRCLLSLPCPVLSSKAVFVPSTSGDLIVLPPDKLKAKKAALATLDYLQAEPVGGVLTVESNIPEAKGCGSSTADCVAAVIATTAAMGRSLSEAEVARLVVNAEIASGNLMFKDAVLFAHREGVVLENYSRKIPALEVLSLDTAEDELVHTLEFPPATYTCQQQEIFQKLISDLQRAMYQNDVKLLGRVATASSWINDLFLPKPLLPEVQRLAGIHGAVGVSVAHSGTMLSILFAPVGSDRERHMDAIQKELLGLGISRWLHYRT